MFLTRNWMLIKMTLMFKNFKQCRHRRGSLRLEGEPVRALSCLLRVALHAGSVRGARRLCAAAADVRPEV